MVGPKVISSTMEIHVKTVRLYLEVIVLVSCVSGLLDDSYCLFDAQCNVHYYCDVKSCKKCINCTSLNRETLEFSPSCIKSADKCGECSKGFVESGDANDPCVAPSSGLLALIVTLVVVAVIIIGVTAYVLVAKRKKLAQLCHGDSQDLLSAKQKDAQPTAPDLSAMHSLPFNINVQDNAENGPQPDIPMMPQHNGMPDNWPGFNRHPEPPPPYQPPFQHAENVDNEPVDLEGERTGVRGVKPAVTTVRPGRPGVRGERELRGDRRTRGRRASARLAAATVYDDTSEEGSPDRVSPHTNFVYEDETTQPSDWEPSPNNVNSVHNMLERYDTLCAVMA